MTDSAGWTLVNGEERNREFPETFEVPSREERTALQPGDEAKLIFERVTPLDGAPSGERMWVEVTKVGSGFYIGTFADSSEFFAIQEGHPVVFGPEHIIAINKDWGLLEREIMVSVTIHEQNLRPQILARQDPISERDSGWAAMTGDETDEDLRNADKWLPQQVAYFLTRWPDTLLVLRTDPSNGEWNWNEALGGYVKLS